MADENVQFFLRAVSERFRHFKSRYAELLSELTAEDLEKKLAAAKGASSALDDLLAIISQKDWPAWANTIKGALDSYIRSYKSTGAGNQLLKVLMSVNNDMAQHKWSFQAVEGSGVDFEALYEVRYKASKAPELFEHLLELLQQIVNSGEVDSVKAIGALEKMIATIRANMRGTYFQTVGMSHFVFALMKNYLWKVLKSNPAIGPLLEAVTDTMKDLDIEMSQVHAEVRKQLGEFANGEIGALKYERHDIKALPRPSTSEP